jgi:hypothetical protein
MDEKNNNSDVTTEIDLDDESIAILKELSESGKPLNLGTDSDPLWVCVTWLDDASVKLSVVKE